MNGTRRGRVFVGLSGGVDSAVSAHLLKEEGHDVTGVFIKGWEPDFLPCTGTADRLEAMRVAAHLGIPFKTYDFEEQYKNHVVDYFVNEYRAGRTPNPDVMCNRLIKFGAFWKKASEEGAEYIATGHYARNEETSSGFELSVSKDSVKDQTYFLWTLTQDDLEHALFPIGSKNKSEVRSIAKKIALPNASRKDSQGLCFLGHVDMRDFLSRYIPKKRGSITLENGDTVGEHEGVWFYTYGEHVDLAGSSTRMYVVRKNIASNEIVVSDRLASSSGSNRYELAGRNWIDGVEPSHALCRYRYRGELHKATIDSEGVLFTTRELIAPGQSIVFYDSAGVCLGGGVIGRML